MNSKPSSAKVKNEWSYSSNPPIHLHSMQRNYFYYFFILLVSFIFIFTFTLEVKMKSGLIWCWIPKDSTFQHVPSFYVCMKQKQTYTNE
jgi:hypothetical protein